VKKIIASIAIIAVLIVIVVYAYMREKSSSAGMPGFGRGPVTVSVRTTVVESGKIAKKILATGAISALAEVEVYPRQTGEIVKLLADKGDKVKAGQILAQIESSTFEIQMKQAKADLASAQATYDKDSPLASISSETDFKQAKSNLDRLQSVFAQAELDLKLQEKQADVKVKKAEADSRIAQARLGAAISGAREQELEQAKVRADNAKRDLDRMTALLKDEMVSQDQVEAAQLQYDIYSAQLSLMMEGARPEDVEVLKAQVETAKASLESAENDKMLIDIKQSSLDAAKAQVDDAQAAFDHATATRDALTWEKDLVKAKAAVEKAEASLEMVQKSLDDTIIQAPIDGIISQRLLDKGDLASPNRPFVTIVDMDMVRILAKVPVRDIVEIKLGDQAIIKPDAYPGKSFPGTVANISPVVDRTSQTCDIEIEAVNADHKLKPGMFTRIELTTQEHENVPIIPVDVIQKDGAETFVYVVEDSKAARKNVITGISDSIRTEVISGLGIGDDFIVAGYHSLSPGASVVLAGAKAPASVEGDKQ